MNAYAKNILLILEVEVLDTCYLSKFWDMTQLKSPPNSKIPELCCNIVEKIVRIKPGSSLFGAYISIRQTSIPLINPFTILNLPAESL